MLKESFNPILIKNELAKTFRYINCYGETYGDFTYATEYENGYAKVIVQGETEEKFIDLMGRVGLRKTPIGTMFYKFMKGLITFDGISDHFFGNEDFATAVEKELMERLNQKIYNEQKHGKKIPEKTIQIRQQRIKEMIREKKAKLKIL